MLLCSCSCARTHEKDSGAVCRKRKKGMDIPPRNHLKWTPKGKREWEDHLWCSFRREGRDRENHVNGKEGEGDRKKWVELETNGVWTYTLNSHRSKRRKIMSEKETRRL